METCGQITRIGARHRPSHAHREATVVSHDAHRRGLGPGGGVAFPLVAGRADGGTGGRHQPVHLVHGAAHPRRARSAMTNELLTSPAAERNKDPILTVLESVLPPNGSVLEIASGTGQRVCFFAAGLPGIRWQTTEADAPPRADTS